MFEALTGKTGIVGTVSIGGSHIKAHRSAAGGKEGTTRRSILVAIDTPPTIAVAMWLVRWRYQPMHMFSAIGRSRGGRTTKIHALTDDDGRPRVLLLSPGNINDIALAPALLAAAGPIKGPDCRQSLRRQQSAPASRRSARQSGHSFHDQPQATHPLQQEALYAAQSDRAHVRPPQRLPPYCHAL